MAIQLKNTLLIYLIIFTLLTCLTSAKHHHRHPKHPHPKHPKHSKHSNGVATFYTPPYNPSACFGNKHIDGVMIAALSEPLYKGGSACGQHFEVTCVGGIGGSPNPCRGKGKVVVKAVDLCPKGCRGTIDLSQEAFASIADPDAGVIKIAFRRV